ncbi:MAG: hypothetical protein IKW00_08715 [Clostridia bacterium]|nr:hypothetical protein [Clostridia bacterium]
MKKSLLLWLSETVLLLLAAFLPMVMHLWPGDTAAALSFFCSHLLYPSLSFFLPLWAAKQGASAFFCALMPFCIYLTAWLLWGLTPPALPCIFTLVAAVIGACAGDEIRKRPPRRQK